MKRIVQLFIVIFLFSIQMIGQNNKYSRLSMTLEAGLCALDGDVNEDQNKIISTTINGIGAGASLEYTITPIFGLSLGYQYLPTSGYNANRDLILNTKLSATTANFNVNLIRILFPYNEQRFNLYASAGWGIASYNYNPILKSTNTSPSDVLVYEGEKKSTAKTIPVSLAAEYNITKYVSIGAKGYYNSYLKDNLEGVKSLASTEYSPNIKGSFNDYIAAGNIYLRYKFHSKNRPHIQDINMNKFQPAEVELERKMLAENIDSLKDQYNLMRAVLDKRNNLQPELDSLAKQVDSLKIKQNKLIITVDSLTQRVSLLERSIPEERVNKEPIEPKRIFIDNAVASTDSIISIHFASNKDALNPTAKEIIKSIAKRLESQPALKIQIIGFTDSWGNTLYNLDLSQRRANNIRLELINQYKIDARRINMTNKGEIEANALFSYKYRRCDIVFIHK